MGEARPLLAGFHRLEVPLLDEHGRSRWSERFTPERIEAIRRRTGPAKFESEVMLRPRSIIEGRLDPTGSGSTTANYVTRKEIARRC